MSATNHATALPHLPVGDRWSTIRSSARTHGRLPAMTYVIAILGFSLRKWRSPSPSAAFRALRFWPSMHHASDSGGLGRVKQCFITSASQLPISCSVGIATASLARC